jgi:hypothetical protein
MNERIKLLAEQAQKVAYYTDGGYTPIMTLDQEKFAELIVRECLKICQNHPSVIFKNEWDADVVSTDIVSRLESHFGVEE